jgi:pyrimidine-nucleoside phosphorylase/thymidine phosphorylase
MRATDVIARKRDGEELSAEEIAFLIRGVVSGAVPHYQAAAFLMAVRLRGMSSGETVALTRAMLGSGAVMDFGEIAGPKVDKHSTGGVGDKTSIILAPLAAAMGLRVPMVSGRGLGHTGGTLDKLAAIPGMRTDLSAGECREQLDGLGAFMAGQSSDIAPADSILYALRDVTATVDSIPLIASSIMSKKLAEGLDGLVLDVKTGAGAFMKTLEEARELARTLVGIGTAMDVRTVALITDMDQPLGRTVGNALEVKECLSALRNTWPDDLRELTVTLAAWMLNVGDAVGADADVAPLGGFALNKYQREALEYIERGDAFRKFAELVDAQEGDPEAAFEPARLPRAPGTRHIKASGEGHVQRLDARAVGTASVLLGAGRSRAEDEIDPAAGIILLKKVGDRVEEGEPLAMFHYSDEKRLREAEEAFTDGLRIGYRDPARRPLIIDVVMSGSL